MQLAFEFKRKVSVLSLEYVWANSALVMYVVVTVTMVTVTSDVSLYRSTGKCD